MTLVKNYDLKNARIAILYSKTHLDFQDAKLINLLKKHWVAWGAEVIDVHGTETFIPADLVIVHVDLSVVPVHYREFANRYPRQINADVLDIRKSFTCGHLLKKGDSYEGPVIVKSDLNYAGIPERTEANLNRSKWERLSPYQILLRKFQAYNHRHSKHPDIQSKEDYRIYERIADVPRKYFGAKTVVQKFLPEISGDSYIIREYYFLNHREIVNVEMCKDSNFTTGVQIEVLHTSPHAEVVAFRKRLKMDYGKIDYAMHEGGPIIFDANKTVGTVSDQSVGANAFAVHLAPAILDLLE